MRVSLMEAGFYIVGGIGSLVVLMVVWEAFVDWTFKKFGEWWFNGKE